MGPIKVISLYFACISVKDILHNSRTLDINVKTQRQATSDRWINVRDSYILCLQT